MMNAVSMAEKRPACAHEISEVNFVKDASTHEDKEGVDIVGILPQKNLILLLKPDLCTSPLRS
jgi:hypothetical protein